MDKLNSYKLGPDQNGRFGIFGGRFVAETLMPLILDLEKSYQQAKKDDSFQSELAYLNKYYTGRPSPLYFAKRLTDYLKTAKIYFKRDELNHTGSHKINNCLGQILLAKRMGKTRIIAETGAGQHGVAVATVSARFGLPCVIYMGAKDIERQRPNVEAIRKNGASIVPVTSGSQTLVDAVSECMRYWVANNDTTNLCVGSTVGPNIFVKICAWSTAQISRELIKQVKEEFGKIPKKMKLLNCVGGGSSAMGFWNEFMDTDAEFVGIEAGGPKNSKLHAAPLTNGSKIGILHGAAQYVIQDQEGQIGSTQSISAGLDYPGISPLHCFLKDSKRAKYTSASDEEALKAYKLVSKLENISPSLEPSHAFAEAIKLAPKLKSSDVIIVNSCGDSLKDKDIIKQKLGSYIR